MPKTDGSFDPARYATVAERIELFYRSHPTGRIETDLVTRDAESVTFRARVYRNEADTVAAATGWAAEREGDGDINTVACLENTETSAIGRALANLGFTASRQRPSLEEMRKAEHARVTRSRAVSSRAIAERSPGYGQHHAHAAADLLNLLAEAERAGLRMERASRLRVRLEQPPPLSPARIAELERSLRRWLSRRDDVTAHRLSP